MLSSVETDLICDWGKHIGKKKLNHNKKDFFNDLTIVELQKPAVVMDYLQDGGETNWLSLRLAATVTFGV